MHWWAFRIGRPPSSVFMCVCMCMYVNIFKHILLWNHWANQSQISYGASFTFSLEPKGRWSWNLICSIGSSSTTKFIQMVWPWPILRQGQLRSPVLLYGEKGKTMDFSEIIVVHDLKLAADGRSDKLTSKRCPHWGDCPLTRGYIQVLNH